MPVNRIAGTGASIPNLKKAQRENWAPIFTDEASFREPRTMGRLSEAGERWIYTTCLCFALELGEQKQSGIQYKYSALAEGCEGACRYPVADSRQRFAARRGDAARISFRAVHGM